jgi:hypothetical protein
VTASVVGTVLPIRRLGSLTLGRAANRLLVLDPARFVGDPVGPAGRGAAVVDRAPSDRSMLLAIDGEELDEEANRPERLDVVLHVGGDTLGPRRVDGRFERGVGRRAELQPPVVDHEASPAARGNAVSPAKTRGHRVFIPHLAGADEAKALG